MGNKKMLESEAVKEQIAKALAGGQSQAIIAQAVGVSQPTISRLANKGDVRAMIERQSLSLLEGVPQAVENLKAQINEMPNIPPEQVKRKELGLKASIKLLESAGLLNTPSPSPTFVNIINARTTIISPVVERLLELMQKSSDLPPLEVNFEKEGNDGERITRK
jgi:predicted XRE-type DNA-binding protein